MGWDYGRDVLFFGKGEGEGDGDDGTLGGTLVGMEIARIRGILAWLDYLLR